VHPSLPTRPRTLMCRRLAAQALLFVAACAGPNSAMSEPTLCVWARGKTPIFRLIYPPLVHTHTRLVYGRTHAPSPAVTAQRRRAHTRAVTVEPSPVKGGDFLGSAGCAIASRIEPCRMLAKYRITSSSVSSCRAAALWGLFLEHLPMVPKTPGGNFLPHAGSHVILAAVDPADLVLPSNHMRATPQPTSRRAAADHMDPVQLVTCCRDARQPERNRATPDPARSRMLRHPSSHVAAMHGAANL
jgi:hypothetical protein